jgi:hypothetical protein
VAFRKVETGGSQFEAKLSKRSVLKNQLLGWAFPAMPEAKERGPWSEVGPGKNCETIWKKK